MTKRREGILGLCFVVWLCAGAAAAVEPDAGSEVAADSRIVAIEALTNGALPASVSAQSFFDVRLDDEHALSVERQRLRGLLFAAALSDAGLEPLDESERAQWHERLKLDRARLAFYELPVARRAALLRPPLAPPARDGGAESERQLALAAAQAARAANDALARDEVLRLSGLRSSIAAERERLAAERAEVSTRHEVTVGWQRRVQEARAKPSTVDATYDALRRALLSTRDELDEALGAIDDPSSLPGVESTLKGDVTGDEPVEEARALFGEVHDALEAALTDEELWRVERSTALFDEMTALNFERLSILGSLSTEKRAAVTGFTEAGFDQAGAEKRHLWLTLRYHRHIATSWYRSLGHGTTFTPAGVWRVAIVAVPWVIAALVYVWARRRSPALLRLVDERIARTERAERRVAPSALYRAIRVLRGVHSSLETLVFFLVLVWLLPEAAQELLEVQLLTLSVGYALGGAFAVDLINALAKPTESRGRAAIASDELRLRSLRFVGRVCVVFALMLTVSDRMVGRGTIYAWVLIGCWVAALAMFLVLVKWWRAVIFERVEQGRRKSVMQQWVLANRNGWQSFFAAMVAAVQLFLVGIYKTVRSWLSEFTLARRAHAYLFKRELDRLASERLQAIERPLEPAAFASMSPDNATSRWLANAGDETVEAICKRIATGRAGVIALVGGQGSGKTSLLHELASRVAGTVMVRCDEATGAQTIEQLLAEAPAKPPLIVLDDVDAIVKPILGGLKTFDALVAKVRSTDTCWVFAIDDVVWPFLSRARDNRPLFDEVFMLRSWSDEEIGTLLTFRTEAAGLTPVYDDLLEKMPEGADEVERLEALAARRQGYFRMVWDYANGNPGVALEVWRTSLVMGDDGTARVRALNVPDAAELEALPDNALFVLRAVLQMAPATVGDIVRATRLPEAHVQDAVRFGQTHGYLQDDAGRARVAWPWLRAVVQLLERRHLLVRR